jgi:gluconolactonase
MNEYPSVGKIHRLDPALDELIAPDARLEKLADGFTWTEGPIWVTDGSYLLFSDIPRNSIFRWKEGEGTSLFLNPSGYTGSSYYGLEPGSNGMTLDSEGRLIACEHGDRRVSRLYKDGGKMTLADAYQGKRLNSPNDLVYKSDGMLYFTDPAYGIPDRYEDTTRRELDFCGVFRVSPEREVELLTDELIKPNGLAFSPDESVLYVSQSDLDRAIWMRYPVKADGTLDTGDVFYDVTDHASSLPGAPDGFKVDERGNLFATGPGGVWIFSPEGKALGRIDTGQRTANCAWGDDGSTLYITAHMLLLRIETKTRAAVMPGGSGQGAVS